MQILPVSLNNNNSFGFKAKLMHQQSVGMLQRTTSYNMEGILHAYREIMTKLSRKTEEGLNFIRLTITNSEGNNQKMYLIKDFKYIVKNFNPKYPEIIPKTPVYAEENPEIAEYISDCSKYLVKKLQSVIDLVSNQPVTQKRYRSERPAIKTDNPEYNDLVKECLKEFKYAMKNINSLGEFQKTMNEINQKVAEYHKNHHS